MKSLDRLPEKSDGGMVRLRVWILIFTGLFGQLNVVQARAMDGKTERRGALQRWSQLPMSFEANQGQTDGNVRFMARGIGYQVLFKSTGISTVGGRVSKFHFSAQKWNLEIRPRFPAPFPLGGYGAASSGSSHL